MADFVEVKEVEELQGYLSRLSFRAESLKASVDELDVKHDYLASEAKSLKKKSSADVAQLKNDVRELKDSVREIQTIMIMMIGQMKNTLKQADFQNFEKRLDLWAPETLVTRQEARRLVKKLKA